MYRLSCTEELDALGITRQQLKTGNFYSVNKVLGFKTNISNLETKMKDLTPDKSTLEPIETASIDEIRDLQLKKLKWSLHHAYENVTAYREKFDSLSVHPDDLKTLSDLSKFPFTTKLDLRKNYPFGMVPWSLDLR